MCPGTGFLSKRQGLFQRRTSGKNTRWHPRLGENSRMPSSILGEPGVRSGSPPTACSSGRVKTAVEFSNPVGEFRGGSLDDCARNNLADWKGLRRWCGQAEFGQPLR